MADVRTRAELLSAGWSSAAISRAVRAGRLVPVLRGIYAVAELDLETRARAARRAWGERVIVSLTSAAAVLLDEPRSSDGLLHLEVPFSLHVRNPPWVRLHQTELPVEHRIVRGLAVTTPAQTILDLTRRLPRHAAVPLADALAHRYPGALERARQLSGLLPEGARGCRLAAGSLALCDPRAESVFESQLRLIFIDGDVAPDATQLAVYDADGILVARLDFAWRRHRLAAEADGRAYHSDALAFRRDRERQNALAALGWRMLRFTYPDLNTPRRTQELVRRMIASTPNQHVVIG